MGLYMPTNWQNNVTPRSSPLLDNMENGIQHSSLRYIGAMSGSQTITNGAYTTLKFGTGSIGNFGGDATYANMCYVDAGYNYGFIVPENMMAICTLFVYPPAGFNTTVYCEIISTGSRLSDYKQSTKTNPKIHLFSSGAVETGDVIRAVIQPTSLSTFTFSYRFSLFLY